jgi:hypothetical protein
MAPAPAEKKPCPLCGYGMRPGQPHYCPDANLEVVFEENAVAIRVWSRETQAWWSVPLTRVIEDHPKPPGAIPK